MNLAREIAELVAGTTSIPNSTRNMVRHAILDLMTAAIAGFSTDGARISKRAAFATWGKGRKSCWFSDDKLPVAGAAFVNSAMASILDLDDGHRAAAGHPGASIIPAVFADADIHRHDTGHLATAITIGYEVAVRSSAARNLGDVDTLVSGRWVAQGVAAAIGWLRELDASVIAQAIAIAATHAPNLNAVAYSNEMGNHVKEGIPWATACGFAAVDLAEAGFTGPTDCFDNAHLFDRNTLISAFGDRWAIEGVYFKPYSCCRWAHAAIDACLELQASHDIVPASITRIEVRTFSRALQLNNDVRPSSLEAAQYSIPFCLALAAVRGPSALLPLAGQSLKDSDVLDLSAKISLAADGELTAMFSKAVPAEIEITTDHQTFVRRVMSPKGESSNPMDWNDLIAKFDVTTNGLVSSKRAHEIQHAANGFFVTKTATALSALTDPLEHDGHS